MGKEILIERNGVKQTIKMPIDFIDKNSKGEKTSLVSIRVPFVVGAVSEGSKNTALHPKDILLSLNGQKMKYLDEAKSILDSNKGKTISAVVLRDQKETTVPVLVNKEGMLGVQLGGLNDESLGKLGYYKITRQSYTFLESIPVGLEKGKNKLIGYGNQLKVMFNPETKAYKQVGGFYAIFNIFPETWSWEVFWNITAILSIMLGVMNLLPIPALDGGHVMFLLYEIVSGKKTE